MTERIEDREKQKEKVEQLEQNATANNGTLNKFE